MFILVWKAWSNKKSASKTLRRIKGAMRALAVVFVLTTLLSVAAARRASAEMAQTGMRVGKDLMPLVGVLGGSSTISLNGQKIVMKYDGSKMPVKEVLDAAEAACRNGGVRAGTLDPTATPEAQREKPKDAESALLRITDLGIVRSGDDREGLVLCFAKGSQSRASLTEQLDSLEQTGDLGALGKMRYVYARKEGQGTAVLAAVTDDSFKLDALRPSREGDNEGSDDHTLPRPKDSTRFLSAVLDGTPYAVRGYRTHASEEAVRTEFDAAMFARGFTTLEIETNDGAKSNAYLRDGVMVTLAISKDRNGDTLVSLGSMGADDRRPTK
jgi:hypothetical protein